MYLVTYRSLDMAAPAEREVHSLDTALSLASSTLDAGGAATVVLGGLPVWDNGRFLRDPAALPPSTRRKP